MTKAKFKKGDKLYWYSVIHGKPLGGKVIEVGQYIFGNNYVLDCGTDGRWEVIEQKLTKRKNPDYIKSRAAKISQIMGWN